MNIDAASRATACLLNKPCHCSQCVSSILTLITLVTVTTTTEASPLKLFQRWGLSVSGKAGSKQGRGAGNAGVKRAAEVLFQKDWENQTEASEPALSDTSAFPATTEASVRCACVRLSDVICLSICQPVCHPLHVTDTAACYATHH